MNCSPSLNLQSGFIRVLFPLSRECCCSHCHSSCLFPHAPVSPQGNSGGFRDRAAPNRNMTDRDRRERGPLRGVSKGDRGGIRKDRFQPKFNNRDTHDHKKTNVRDAKPRTDKVKKTFKSKKRIAAKKEEDKKEKEEKEEKEDGAEDKKDVVEKSDDKASDAEAKASTEAYCTVCEKFFTGDLVDHRRSATHKEERQRKFPSGQSRCDVCKISYFRNQQALWNHLRSSLHRRVSRCR